MHARRDPTPADAHSPRSVGVVVLTTLAVIAALYIGRVLLVPIALSILFTGLLRPIVRRFERAGLSAPIGATVVLVVLVGVLVIGGLALVDPMRDWVAEAPKTLEAAQQRLQKLRRPLQTITAAAKRMEQAASSSVSPEVPGPAGAAQGRPGQGPPAQRPPAQGPPAGGGAGGSYIGSIAVRVFGTTTALVGAIVQIVLLTLLMLASGDVFLNKLVKVLPLRREKREAVEIAHETEAVVSHYMVVTALINAGQGALVGLAMWLLHVPNPALWGILTFFLEFIPFLGGAAMIILLTLAGLATSDGIGKALLPPAIYLTITTLQNNLVSPVAYGRRLRLNPVAVLVGVLFWYYIWGVAGAFLAVPILATFKILGDHLERLSPVSEFLSD
jgi:predicted PurR-regulated permease PerM